MPILFSASRLRDMFIRRSIGLLIMGWVLSQQAFAGDHDVKQEIPYETLRTFTEVFARIKTNYVKEVDDKVLLENAIRGMLSGLDPHSAYLDLDEFADLQENTSGEFGGLGIEVTMDNGFVKVVSPIDDTPAQRADIRSGDLIIRLGDKPVKGLSLNEAVKLMRGKPGTPIELTIVRENVDGPFKVVLERDIIHVKSVRAELIEPNFAYIRLSNFQVKTGDDLLSSINKLKKENKSPIKGLILDLRNNPGGVLSAAVDVADAFLDSGLIVYTEGRTENASLKYKATSNDILNGVPMVVLVNSGSASASEIVAGAIQDHVRGIIMGSDTFGKGSVQTILELNSGSAVKLTTAHYYTPKGRSIQAEGIEPDIKLKRARVELLDKKNGVAPLKEFNLSGHLNNPNGEDKQEQPRGGKKKSKIEKNLVSVDYELFEALNLLKGLTILKPEPKK